MLFQTAIEEHRHLSLINIFDLSGRCNDLSEFKKKSTCCGQNFILGLNLFSFFHIHYRITIPENKGNLNLNQTCTR